MNKHFDHMDARITEWMARHGVVYLRVSLGVVFLWFGVLKIFPGISPAEELAGKTILKLSGGLIGPATSVPLLGVWESLIGLGLVTGKAMRATLLLLFLQMPGTVAPVALFPGEVFHRAPLFLTLEGQYIVKNLVLVSAAIVIGATVRGGSLRAEPSGRAA